MSQNDKYLDNQHLKMLMDKLPFILTLSEQDVVALLRKAPDEAASIAAALELMGPKASRKERQWLGHSMASLPLENWTKQDGLYSATPTRDASLRYLLQDAEAVTSEGEEQLKSRQRLYDELSKHWNDIPARFQPMLERTQLYPRYPLYSDIALAGTIDKVEQLFLMFYTRAEDHCRAVNLLTDALDRPTPVQFIPRLAKQALSDTRELLEELTAGSDEQQRSNDHLVAHVMCNVAANRCILESARLGALAKDAVEVNVTVIEALNSRGIVKVPEVQSDKDIEDVLSHIFGKGGELADVEGVSRFLSGNDLATTIATAKTLQAQYLLTRGRPGASLHPAAHRTPMDTLMFALVLAGVFATCAKVEKEFFGKDRWYAAFPGRGTPARDGLLRPHALELAKTMYSQMAFANVGWGMQATHVREYEQAMAVKRSCLQTLFFTVFKRWPAGKLCALHRALSGSAGSFATAPNYLGKVDQSGFPNFTMGRPQIASIVGMTASYLRFPLATPSPGAGAEEA